MKAFKGISPLVAVVMLIAFTLLISGIILSMTTTFTEEQTTQIKYCGDAKFELLGGVYNDAGGGLSTVNFNIHNTGDVDLNFNLLQTKTNGIIVKVPTSVLVEPKDVAQLKAESINISESKQFRVQSIECSGLKIDLDVGDLSVS